MSGERRVPQPVVAVLLVAAAACARGPAPPQPPPAPTGPAFVFYYRDGAGVHRLDARDGRDSLLFAVARGPLASALSPDKARLALGYRGADSSRLVVLDGAAGSMTQVHATGRTYRYTAAWSRDGARLAVGYFTERRVGNETLPNRGDIVILPGASRRPVRVGCEASKIVYAWVSADTIVVGDGRDLFPVDARGCRSDAAMRLQGKRGITFSPDGKRLFYYATGRARRGSRTVTVTELYLAGRDGSNARRVIGDPYDPQHARWSPDGSRIAFDVRPPGAPTLRHIAVFDVIEQRVRFFPSKTADGTARDTSPFWGPAGGRLVHDRVLGTGAVKILRSLALDPSVLQVEPTVLLSGKPLGSAWGWADDSHLVVVSERWVKLVDTGGAVVYEMPGERTMLGVMPAR